MKSGGLVAVLIFGGCQIYPTDAGYKCDLSDPSHACPSGYSCVSSTCVLGNGSSGVATSGTTGSGSGSSSGGGTTGSPLLEPAGRAVLSIVGTPAGAPIEQIFSLGDGGAIALGPSLWYSDGGAWSEILGDLLPAAENISFAEQRGFQLRQFVVSGNSWIVQVDAESDAGGAALPVSSFFFKPALEAQPSGYPWGFGKQFPPVYSAAGNDLAGGTLFTDQWTEGDRPALTYDDSDELGLHGAPTQTFGPYRACGVLTSLADGPLLSSYRVDDGGPFGVESIEYLPDDDDFAMGIDAGGYASANLLMLPADYAPAPVRSSESADCIARAEPMLAVQPQGSGVQLYFGGGAYPEGGSETVWQIAPRDDAGSAVLLFALDGGGPLSFGLDPAGSLWIGDGHQILTWDGANATMLGTLAEPVTTLGLLGDRMLAGTPRGIVDVAAFLAGDAGQASAGLNGTKLTAFAQDQTHLYALSGADGDQPGLLIDDGGGFSSYMSFDELGQACSSISAFTNFGLLVVCDAGVFSTGAEKSFPDVAAGLVISVSDDNNGATYSSAGAGQPVQFLSFSKFVPSGMGSLPSYVVGPVWGAPGGVPAPYGFAYSSQPNLLYLLDATGTPYAASVSGLTLGGGGGLPGAVDPSPDAGGKLFELPTVLASGGFQLAECATSDTGFAIACLPLCTVAPGALELSFDAAGNLFALTHLPLSDPFSTLSEDSSHLYVITASDRARVASLAQPQACPELALQFPVLGSVSTVGYPEGLLGLGVVPAPLADGGTRVFLRGTRHPLTFTYP